MNYLLNIYILLNIINMKCKQYKNANINMKYIIYIKYIESKYK